MGNVMSLILEQKITPAVNNTFWSIIGNWFVSVGAILRDAVFNLLYVLCKFALNVVDFMQLLVQKLAGVDAWVHLERLDLDNLQETDIVFRFLLSDTVQTVFRSMIAIFLVLLIVFSIIAIIKNEYGAATSGKAVEHKQTWYNAFKAIITVILVPILLIGGILTSNAILAGLMRAFSINSSLSLSGQIFMASAYDASDYRRYASNNVRMPVSNAISYVGPNGKTYYVDTQINVVNPKYYTDSNPFYGYMFTFNGTDYFLWECNPQFEGSTERKDYNYLKYILGAYIVEANPNKNTDSTTYSYFKSHYNNNLANDSYISTKVATLYGDYSADYKMNTVGWINGYVLNDLSEGAGTILTAARNTWGYNQDLTSGISGWAENNDTLQIITNNIFTTATSSTRTANLVKNSDNWAGLHDGGIDGYHPLAVEYEVMADVIDFALGNNVKLYFVNSNNSMINYYFGSSESTQFDRSTLYVDTHGQEAGYLVEYKKFGRVAYPFSPVGSQSEIEGATYIVCYYDPSTGVYAPLSNGVKMYDEFGNSYTFKSGKFADSYHGVVIARGIFKKTSNWVGFMPTYIAQTMVIDSNGVSDFNDADLVAANALNTGYYYNYLQKLSNQDGTNYFVDDVSSGDAIYEDGKYVYYSASEMTREELAKALYQKFDGFVLYDSVVDVFDDAEYGAGSFEVGDQFAINLSYGTTTDENYQKYILDFKYTGKKEVLSGENTHVIAYQFDLRAPRAFGYASDLEFADFAKAPVAGYPAYSISYDHELERQFTFYSTTDNVITDPAVHEALKIAVPQIIGNTQYLVLGTPTYDSIDAGSTGTLTLILYESSSSDAGDYVRGAKKWIVRLIKEEATTEQDGIYAHQFAVAIETEDLHLDGFEEFNDIEEMDYTSENIGTTGQTLAHNIRYYDSNIHYFSDDSHFDETVTAFNSTVKIGKYLADKYAQSGYTAELLTATVTLSRAEILGYSASFMFKVTKDSEVFRIKISLEMTDRIDTGKTIDDQTGESAKKVYERIISVSYDVQNMYKIHSTATIESVRDGSFNGEMYEEIQSIPAITLDDLEYDGTDVYYVNGTAVRARQFTYADYTDSKHTKTLVFNAYALGESNVDGGYVFAGYHKNGEGNYVYNEIGDYTDEQIKTLFYKLSEVRIVKTADYVASKKVETADHSQYTKYYILDLQNVGESRIYLYEFTVLEAIYDTANNKYIIQKYTGFDDENCVWSLSVHKFVYNSGDKSYSEVGSYTATTAEQEKALAYIRAHVNISYEYLSTKKFADYNTAGSTGLATLYSVMITAISGTNYTFYATNVDSAEPATPENYEKCFFNYLTIMSDGSIDYKTSNVADADASTHSMLERFTRNPLTVVFCRDEMEERWINLDFRLHLYWSGLAPHFIFRFYIGSQIVKANNNVSVSLVARSGSSADAIQVLNHKQVVSLRSGMLAIDYNFLGNVAVDNVYILYAVNWLVMVIAIVIVFSILGKAVWGLIKRIYQITLLFLIMPAVASTIPLDGSKRFGDWRKQIIEEVLGTYGICLGLNFFFIIMPVIRDASAIFTDADISTKTLGMLGYIVNADMLNLLCYILFLLVALTLLKSVPPLVSKFVGGKDAISEGDATKKAVLNTVTEAGNIASGKAAMDAVKKAGDVVLGEKGKDGKRHGGLIPGMEFGRAAKGTVDKWRDKNAQRKADIAKQREEFNKNAAHDNAENNIDAILSRGKELPDDVLKKASTPVEAPDMIVNEGETPITPKIEIVGGATESGRTTGGAGSTIRDGRDAATLSGVESAVHDTVEDAISKGEGKDDGAVKSGEIETDGTITMKGGEADTSRVADKTGEAVDSVAREQIRQLASALKEVNDASVGKYHDYKGDQEKADAAAKAQEIADRRHARESIREERRADRDEAKAARVEAKNEAIDAQIKHYKDEAESGKLKRTLSKSDIARWNKEHADKQIVGADAFSRMTAEAKEDQRQIRREARQEAYMHDNLLKARDLENGIKHGALASAKRKLVGGEKTAAQKEKEQEALDKSRAGLADAEKDARKEMHNSIVADLKKKPEFAKKSKKALDMLADERIKSNFDKASEEDKKNFMKKWASEDSIKNYNKALKAVKKDEAATKEEKKGALYKTGKGVAFVGGKAGEGAAWLGGKAKQGMKFVGGKVGEGASWLGGKAKQGMKFVGSKVAAAALATKDFTAKVGKAVANSAPVKATVKAAKKVGGAVGKAGRAVGGAVGKAGKAVGRAVGEAGKAVGKAGKAVGGAVAKGVTTAGKAVGKAVSTAGKAVAGVANKAVGKVRDAASFISTKATKTIHAASDKIKGTVWYQYLKDSAKNVKNVLNRRKNDKAFVAARKPTDADVENMSKRIEKKLAGRKNVSKKRAEEQRDARIVKAGTLRNKAGEHESAARTSRGKIKDAELKKALGANNDLRRTLASVYRDIDSTTKAKIDRELARERVRLGRHRVGPNVLERIVKKELNSRLKELNQIASSGGLDAATNKELNRLKAQLSRITSANMTYNKRIKTLSETNKALARKVKANKGGGAIASQLNKTSSFGDNASGKK